MSVEGQKFGPANAANVAALQARIAALEARLAEAEQRFAVERGTAVDDLLTRAEVAEARLAEAERALREIAAEPDEVLHQFGDARGIARAYFATLPSESRTP